MPDTKDAQGGFIRGKRGDAIVRLTSGQVIVVARKDFEDFWELAL